MDILWLVYQSFVLGEYIQYLEVLQLHENRPPEFQQYVP